MLTAIYDLDGVNAWESLHEHCRLFFGVSDADFQHYYITFSGDDDGNVSLSVEAAWSDKHPGKLTSYTYDLPLSCSKDDTLEITDDGMLTAMVREKGAKGVDFRQGILMQLPVTYVQPIRLVIAKAREMAARMAAETANGKRRTMSSLLTVEEHSAADWWLSTHEAREQDSWMRRAGNTGLIGDAYRAFQSTTAGLAPAGWYNVQA